MTSDVEIRKGEAIVLPDGTKVLPEPEDGKKVVSALEQAIDNELDEFLSNGNALDNYKIQRTLADVRTDFKTMNAIMLVKAYTLWGLDHYAISHLLSVDVDTIKHLQENEHAVRIGDQLVEALRYNETSKINGYLAEKAKQAAMSIVYMLNDSNRDRVLSAAKDILDRTGYRPVDRVEHSMRFEDELRIVRIEEKKAPTIDITP